MDEDTILAEEREKTYRFLSSLCLKPPSSSIISMIKEGKILLNLQEESRVYKELSRFVKDAGEIPNLEDEMAAEHTAIFVMPGGVLPHEAVYLDKEKRLGGRRTINVRQFYEKAGASLLESCIEMPDHLGMELEFMGFLCRIEKELRKKGDLSGIKQSIGLQKAFLDGHLTKWVYQCCENIIKKARYGFYKAIAYLIIEFMKGEEGYVAELYAKVFNNEEEGICKSAIQNL